MRIQSGIHTGQDRARRQGTGVPLTPSLQLRGLQVGGQPFFGRHRPLVLSPTGCPQVLELWWLQYQDTVMRHFQWLLWRLDQCPNLAQPWEWTSWQHEAREVLRLTAWLTSPVGYEEYGAGIYARFRLYLHGASTSTAPQWCDAACDHRLLPANVYEGGRKKRMHS